MQDIVNNKESDIEKLKVQNTKQEAEIEALKSLENKIKKTENMSEVIFMVIKNIQENEHIRQEESKIFENILNDQDQILKSLENKNETIFTKDLIKRLETEVCDMMYNFLNKKNKVNGNLTYIKFLLEILKDKNKISETNFEVLKRGIVFLRDSYEKYFMYLDKRQNTKLENSVKEISIKDITEVLETDNDTTTIDTETLKNSPEKMYERESLRDTNESREKYKDARALGLSGVIEATEDNRERQSSRRQEILKTLSTKPVSIKEISQKVLGCSEKTIQRELNNLLDEKIIRKEGEKRWSKYCL